MKKVFVSLLLLSSFVLAEEKNKNFWGVQFGLANAKSQQSNVNISVPTHKSYRSAFLLGYEKALCKTCESEYSMRYYGLIDFGTKYNNGETGPAGYHIYTYNFNFNVDLMRNFFNTGSLRYGTFSGLSFGYADHRVKDKKQQPNALTVSGFDLGVNAGLRISADLFSIELYSRFGLLEQKRYTGNFIHKIHQPFQAGIRYTFVF